jgi:carbamoylphosphate synthase large subunit
MHVVFVEPAFPRNQREFVRALAQSGALVTAIGESSAESLDPELKSWIFHYQQVPSVVQDDAMIRAVKWIQSQKPIDRLEATIEAHVLTAARVREACGIPGTSVKTTILCRDKPAMKEALRQAGIPCAQSTGTSSPDDVRAFASRVGYPLILKPRAAAGASGTYRASDSSQLESVMRECGVDRGAAVAVEEYIEGHEGFYDTIAIEGRVAHDFVCHYYPNVLEAMRTRWISPQFITTNRIDTAPAYAEVRALGKRVVEALGIETSPTHMEWFFGSKGLKFSEIGCRPPGVGAWDLHCAANEMDLYREWAAAICWGAVTQRPSRTYSAGIIALRPDRDGQIAGVEGLEEIRSRFDSWIIDCHIPHRGTPTQPVEAGYMANAWIRMRHPDYDVLRGMLDTVGQVVKVRAH